jgi:hypothetical protein
MILLKYGIPLDAPALFFGSLFGIPWHILEIASPPLFFPDQIPFVRLSDVSPIRPGLAYKKRPV